MVGGHENQKNNTEAAKVKKIYLGVQLKFTKAIIGMFLFTKGVQ